MRVYVASSWRNEGLTGLISALRIVGHDIYDFREGNRAAFNWSEIDPRWQQWTAPKFIQGLAHSRANTAFMYDKIALDRAEAVVLAMPCGRSAHLALGYAVGRGKPTAILLANGEPELYYRMADHLCRDFNDLDEWLRYEEKRSLATFSEKPKAMTKTPFERCTIQGKDEP